MLRSFLKASYFVPDLKSARTFPAVVLSSDPMPTGTEMLADWPEGSEEALGMARRLEAAHGSFALTCRLMRVFCPVVETSVSAMLNAGHDIFLGCLIAAKFVGDDHARHILAAFEQLAEELLRSRFVASALHQNIEHGAILIHGPP